MTISMTAPEVMELIGAAVAGGVVLIVLLIGLFIYLLVRPPRRQPQALPPPEAVDYEEMLAVMERMERRLEALERAVEPEAPPQDRILAAGEERPETRRTK